MDSVQRETLERVEFDTDCYIKVPVSEEYSDLSTDLNSDVRSSVRKVAKHCLDSDTDPSEFGIESPLIRKRVINCLIKF